MDRYVGKVAIVTGASSGIGAQIACDLVRAGLIVVGCAREVDVPDIEAFKESLTSAKGKLYARTCDVTIEQNIIDVVKWTEQELGPIWVLVNNAGIIKYANILDENNTDRLRQVLDTNVLAVALFSREVIQSMKRNNVDGHIVCMNSVVGHSIPYFNTKVSFNFYTPSKFAITALVEVLRQELNYVNSKIKITSISPGVTRTNIFSDGHGEEFSNVPKLNPEDISNGILYALGTPPHVQVYELTIKPLGEQL